MSDTVHTTGLEIAVVGMAGRFPGARNTDEFWRNLRDGVESITFFSDEELLAAGVDAAVVNHPRYIKARGILQDADLFDAEFFGFNPREAELLDPQHRLFLECTWQALEDGGCNPQTYSGSIGVCAGVSTNDYLQHNLQSNPELVASAGAFQTSLNNDKDSLATRVSYKLGLDGPSFTVQTACSTSLVAVHLACQCLLSGDCDAALAGGVSVTFPQVRGYLHSDGMIMSRDGHCRAFDEQASGAVVGRGVGVVLLKRLEDALAEGDNIRAVIKGSAINNDGSTKVGFTAPAIEGQAKVIRAAHLRAEIEAETVSYVETHGTGTELGDPIEMAALKEAFGAGLVERSIGLGSVKTNIGHLDAAAGVASLIKTVLALQHRQLPPSLHFERPNPKLGLEKSPFFINAKLSEWSDDQLPRRAGVSSFGMGGTNAHVVLEESPVREDSVSTGPQLLVMSARSPEGLDALTQNLATHIDEQPQTSLADVAYSLQTGRKAFAYKRMLVCENSEDVVPTLRGERGSLMTSHSPRALDAIAFLFPGQGTQYCNMGKDLYRENAIFRKQIDDGCAMLDTSLGRDLKAALFPSADDLERSNAELQQTGLAQPALFVMAYALAKLWMSWGIRPAAMMGHSIGEYVAACLAGVFSLEDALTIVAARARLMQNLPPGGMLAVAMPAADVKALLGSDVSLAADNGPSQCTVSGPIEAIKDLSERLASAGEACKLLHTSHAFHSAMMDPILPEFADVVGRAQRNPPRIRFVSNVTGTWITELDAVDPKYWARHLRSTVRCREGLQLILESTDGAFVEAGPGNSMLSLMAQQGQSTRDRLIVSSMRHAKENRSDAGKILESLGRLWLGGVVVDWERLHDGSARCRVPLPTYPFNRQRYWVEPRTAPNRRVARSQQSPERRDVRDWVYAPAWTSTPLPAPNPGGTPKDWLVFEDDFGLARRVAGEMSAQGHRVVFVRAGDGFERPSEDQYTIRRAVSDDYHQLVRELKNDDMLPDRVAHLWSVTGAEQPNLTAEAFEAAQDRGYFSILAWTQALISHDVTEPVRIHVITNGAQSVTGEEKLRPEKATVMGLCRVIPQELTHIRTQCVDVEWTDADDDRLVQNILTELTGDSTDTVVAYRGRRRWRESFEMCTLAPASDHNARLRQEGVYLITGGLGGVGSDLAAYLAKSAHARLVLIGRTPMPAKADWPSYIETHKKDDLTARRIKRIQALESVAGEVVVEQADVTDVDRMRGVLDRTRQRFGAVNGVIHAAGVVNGPSFCTIDELRREDCLAQFGPKVMGTMVLDELLGGQPLDFVILTSSLAAILGGLRFGAYAASNSFLDAYAQQQHATDRDHWTSVNLDGWLRDRTKPNPQLIAMTPEEGVEAVGHVLTLGKRPQSVLSVTDLKARMAQAVMPVQEERSDAAAPNDTTSRYPRPNLQTDFEPPQSDTQKTIASIWQELLGLEQVGIRDNFFELGGHSLLATQMVNRLKAVFHKPLSVATVFEHSTVQDLAKMLDSDEESEPASLTERSHRGQQRQRALQQEVFAKRRKRTS